MEFCALKTCLIVYLDRTYIKDPKVQCRTRENGLFAAVWHISPEIYSIIYIFLYLKGENHNEINRHCQKD